MIPFRDTLDNIMRCSGIKEDDFILLLRSQKILTDEMIFAISRFIDNEKNSDIFFTKIIGNIEIRIRFFDITVDYLFYNKENKLLAAMCVNLVDPFTLIIDFPNIITEFQDVKERYTIGNDLLDFEKEKQNDLSILRMQVLNEVLTRYYAKILYSLYLQLRRR